MSRVWPSPCCRLRILSCTANMYIDSQCIQVPRAETTGTTISYVVDCPFFPVLSLVVSVACGAAGLLSSVHCRAPQRYWKCDRTKKKKKLAVHSELLSVIFFPLLHSFNTRVAVSHPLTRATHLLCITYAALHLYARPIRLPI